MSVLDSWEQARERWYRAHDEVNRLASLALNTTIASTESQAVATAITLLERDATLQEIESAIWVALARSRTAAAAQARTAYEEAEQKLAMVTMEYNTLAAQLRSKGVP